ncbi:Transcriptional regulator NovG [Polystyrenella longa]|uniref:Transcriptional regulator NovG n=1 Tax=Polystyrenella longa TaxID=2528007 RepID=A0A518CTT2_9PLAN|nr:ParB/RepB/Spo0J family partition protein [Polystyrenella longa]QDU82637.1 Transcriptional regulator NovG [Polystyrenella longa]
MSPIDAYKFSQAIIPLSDITTDAGTQMRESLNQEAIADYAAAMKRGIKFPAIVCLFDGSTYFLVDGFHRYWAAKEAKMSQVDMLVADGSLRDAMLLAALVNQEHGVRRTNADKRNAVYHVLTHDDYRETSSREIALLTGVSHTFVDKIKKKLDPATLPPEEIPPEPKSIVKNTPREHADPEAETRPVSSKTKAKTNNSKEPDPEEGDRKLLNIRNELLASVRGVIEPETDEVRKASGYVLIEIGESLLEGEDI